MKPREIVGLLGVGTPRDGSPLGRLLTLDDVRRVARRRLPRPVYDYVQGGADRELTVRGNERAYRRRRWVPRALQDVAEVDLSADFVGSRWAAPFGFAPTGYTRMISPAGEPVVAAVAAAAEIPYVLSTVASTTIEDIAARAAPPWYQLYVMRDRDLTADLVRRAAAVGTRVLEVSVDTAVSGNRVRDRRNGLTIPPRMTLSTIGEIGLKPGYWTAMLRNPSLDFDQVRASDIRGVFTGGSIADITAQFDPRVGWDDIRALRESWPHTLVLKGMFGAADAATARDCGVDGLHLSNHGGRQLDQAAAPLDLVPEVRSALGDDALLVVDSGVRSGSDVAMAVALGADAAFVGRPYLWGLAAGGEAGVARVAEILTAELRRTMALLGATSTAELRAEGRRLLRG